MLIKILLVISIIVQTLATAYALRLVRATKYNSVWILFIVGFSLLSVERFVQLLMAGGHYVPRGVISKTRIRPGIFWLTRKQGGLSKRSLTLPFMAEGRPVSQEY